MSGAINAMTLGAILALALNSGYGPDLDAKQVECMAKNVYFESRGEPIEGQIAVAHVTMNRVKHSEWPDEVCKVVYDYKQFSWTFLLKKEEQTPQDVRAWKTAVVVARDVMIGNTTDPTSGAQFYHAGYVNPEWNKYMKVSKIIGQHIFYKWDGQWTIKHKPKSQ